MKIAIVTHFPAVPNQPHGGVEAVSVNLVRWLAREPGADVHVVTLQRGVAAPTTTAWEGATVHRLPRPDSSELVGALGPGREAVARFLGELRPHVVHAHDTYGIMTRGLAVPRVFTIHGFIHGDTLVSGTRFARARAALWRWVEHRCWADQPFIVSISPYVRERLTGVARGVVRDIDNPVDERFFDVPRDEWPGTVFCAAAICPRKNQLVLVEALARLVRRGIDARLRLAGPVTEKSYGERMQAAIEAHGLEQRVTLLGQRSTEQIKEELTGASVFALPSLEENSPMGIEEAMAARVPVLTSNRCGMPYMVEHGGTGFLVDPLRVADVERYLGAMLEDAELRRCMGAAARRVAESRFHPASVVRRTLAVYREAIAAEH